MAIWDDTETLRRQVTYWRQPIAELAEWPIPTWGKGETLDKSSDGSGVAPLRSRLQQWLDERGNGG